MDPDPQNAGSSRRRKSWLSSFRKKNKGDASPKAERSSSVHKARKPQAKPQPGSEAATAQSAEWDKEKFQGAYGAGSSISLTGGCHCGAVRFEATTPKIIRIIDCNCSFCSMKGNGYFVVPQPAFNLVKGEDVLTLYEFNTKTAKHLFCRVCGVQSFFRPRAEPSAYAIYATCLDPMSNPPTYVHESFDGQSWKASTEIPNAKTQATI
eukprot:m.11955 g.11955  ORF g.11955 m.11955 type:complete len:208 (-) comp4154_c0_seq1:83-706(-)